MDALLAYASDLSGTEDDAPGEEQASGVAAEASEDVEIIAEQRLFHLGGSEVGVLSFLASCPPWTKLKIHRKFVIAAELEDVCCSEIGFHYVTRSQYGAQQMLGTADEHGNEWSIDANRPQAWMDPTFTCSADTRFSHAHLVDMLALMFEAAAFICQEQPGVWRVCDAADFMDLTEPSICCLSRIQDEAQDCFSLSKSTDAALAVKLCMVDAEDYQWDYPRVVECDAEGVVSKGTTVTVEFRTGQGKLEGYFEGSGQKLGSWDTLTAFWSEESSKLASLWAGCQVSTPGAKDGAVCVRILSG
jgi:hypothetical protein